MTFSRVYSYRIEVSKEGDDGFEIVVNHDPDLGTILVSVNATTWILRDGEPSRESTCLEAWTFNDEEIPAIVQFAQRHVSLSVMEVVELSNFLRTNICK